MAIYVATIPGLAGQEHDYYDYDDPDQGSFLRPIIIEVKNELSIELVFLYDVDPRRRQVVRFIRENNNRNNDLLLTGKSWGAISLYRSVLSELPEDLRYDKIAIISADPRSIRYGEGKRDRVSLSCQALPNRNTGNLFIRNYYQTGRRGGAQVIVPDEAGFGAGFSVEDINTLLQHHEDSYRGFTSNNDVVTHMNIVFHKKIRDDLALVLNWLTMPVGLGDLPD